MDEREIADKIICDLLAQEKEDDGFQLTDIERQMELALDELGIAYIGPEYGPQKNTCIYCGKPHTDFTVMAPTGPKSFHVECTPQFRATHGR